MPIMILENRLGVEEILSNKKEAHDSYRIDYIRKHLSQPTLSVWEDVNVIGYFYWFPIDIVSSGSGPTHKRYGLIYVDLNDFGVGSGKKKRYFLLLQTVYSIEAVLISDDIKWSVFKNSLCANTIY
ncbi:family 1 glycosylhydrolase [Leuconostoc mesenteroides]|uniref:family 1 glycosylhydrolase n=1 Tax=Leuconostoc mesenteroides TaxID=1245 RepID=UPI000A8EC2CE|nr:family 1 glycosylhydrolase [Leuconostoc mesenteroides]